MHKPVPAERVPRALALVALGLAGAGVHAQEAAQEPSQARSFSLTPTFSAAQTWTDNRTLSSTDKQSDLVTQLSPGVRLQSKSGAITGVLDYQLTGVIHRSLSELNQTQHTFNSALLVQPADDRFTVALRGNYARQTVSAFGVQSADPLLETRNTTDVASAGITPALRGTLGGVVNYNVTVSRDTTRAKDSVAGDSDAVSAQAGLSGRSGHFGWGLDASRYRVGFGTQADTTDDRAFASLLWFPDADLRATLRAGRDRSDALGHGFESRTSYGGGVSWTPSPRTTFSFDADRRYYGNSHALSFEYRTARSVWHVSDSRSAASSSGTGALPVTCSDYIRGVFFQLFGREPTPAELLAQCGKVGNDTVIGSQKFLLATRALTRSTDVSGTYLGLRSTFTLAAFRTQADSLQSTDLFGDFTTPSARIYGLTLSASHRLTPRDSLSVVGAWQRTPDAGNIQGNTLKSINVLWSTQPFRRLTLAFGGRHVIFDGPESYDENGLSATLSLQF